MIHLQKGICFSVSLLSCELTQITQNASGACTQENKTKLCSIQKAAYFLYEFVSWQKKTDYYLKNKENNSHHTLPQALVSIQHWLYDGEELDLFFFQMFFILIPTPLEFRGNVVNMWQGVTLSPCLSLSLSLCISMNMEAAGPWWATVPSCWLTTMTTPGPCMRSSREASTYLVCRIRGGRINTF